MPRLGMRVLVACEFSGVVRDAFLARGHDAYSCDILHNKSTRHIQGDVEPLLRDRWDLVIAHPPCTYLSKVGAKHLKVDPFRRVLMVEACRFFLACYNANSPRVAVENPIMFLEARNIIGIEPSQLVDPSQFGANVTKRTYLWLRGLPNLVPHKAISSLEGKGRPGVRGATVQGSVMRLGRWKRALVRSITALELALAMAEQWG